MSRVSRSAALAAAVVSVVGVSSSAYAELAYGITGASAGSSLISFDTATPGVATNVGSLTGIASGESVRAIDFRPANGLLYALSTASTNYTLYTVNLSNGALTTVGSGSVGTAFPTRVSMDFDPVNDVLRVVTGSTKNYRINPLNGALLSTDADVVYGAGDPNVGNNPPFPVGIAYDNNFVGATSTTMYLYDYNLDLVSKSTAPNTGELSTVGPSILSGYLTYDGGVGLDISSSGVAYVSYLGIDAQFNPTVETLGTVNLNTGLVTPIGAFQFDVLDIAVTIPEPASLSLLSLGALALRRRR